MTNSTFAVAGAIRESGNPLVEAARNSASAIFAFARRIVEARMRSRTIRALEALNDYGLKDIGLCRSEIGGIDSHPRYSSRYSSF